MCLMLAPAWLGLKGAWLPYGLGSGKFPSPDGRYALGLGSAVLTVSSSLTSLNYKQS